MRLFPSYLCTRKIRTCIVLTSKKLDYAKEENAQDVLQLFLARYTNLGSEASIKTLFYRYKQQIHV